MAEGFKGFAGAGGGGGVSNGLSGTGGGGLRLMLGHQQRDQMMEQQEKLGSENGSLVPAFKAHFLGVNHRKDCGYIRFDWLWFV